MQNAAKTKIFLHLVKTEQLVFLHALILYMSYIVSKCIDNLTSYYLFSKRGAWHFVAITTIKPFSTIFQIHEGLFLKQCDYTIKCTISAHHNKNAVLPFDLLCLAPH
jgi:hypothetical protein